MKRNDPILVIEDDRVDVLTLQRAFLDASIANPVTIVSTCREALDYLSKGTYQTPALILVDINLPGMTGLEFLRHIKLHERLRRIPVLVLTTSDEERDRHRAFDLSVAGYLVKPMNYDAFVNMIGVVAAYWLLNEPPP